MTELENIMNGKTPMHLACEKGQIDSVNWLLESDSDCINQRDDDFGWTPFHVACFEGK